jgi:hypothetical protein
MGFIASSAPRYLTTVFIGTTGAAVGNLRSMTPSKSVYLMQDLDTVLHDNTYHLLSRCERGHEIIQGRIAVRWWQRGCVKTDHPNSSGCKRLEFPSARISCFSKGR